MGHHAGSAQHSTIPPRPSCCTLLPRQGSGASCSNQHQQHQRYSRKCVSHQTSFPPLPFLFFPNTHLLPSQKKNSGQANYAVAKAGVVGLTRTIAKEWGPAFGVRSNTIAFGFVTTRLTAAKEAGAFITTPDGEKVALGIPGKQLDGKKGDEASYPDIPLRRPASPEEAARAVLAVASPLFSYVNGETIRVTGGRNM